MSIDDSERYKPHQEYEDYFKESDLELPHSSELWLLYLPMSNELLTDIEGQELPLQLNNDGTLASCEGPSGKTYDFVSFASMEPDESVFVSSATEAKIETAGKIARRVSLVHYPDPKELEKISSTDAKQAFLNSIATTSGYFPMQSGSKSSRRSASRGSRPKSSLSELSELTKTPKRKLGEKKSHGHSSGVSAMSSDHSHGEKSKKKKHVK